MQCAERLINAFLHGSGTSGGASGHLNSSHLPDNSQFSSASVASNNLDMPSSSSTTILMSKTNQLSDDSMGSSKSFSQVDNAETDHTDKPVPQQASDTDEATAGTNTYVNKLATASASTVSSIASTEGSLTLEAHTKEDNKAAVTTDEMTTNNLSASPAATAVPGGFHTKKLQHGKYCMHSYVPLDTAKHR